jgi:hypothetical protein
VNNLNNGMPWGLYSLFFAAYGLGVQQIGVVKAVYPAAWGSCRSSPGRCPTGSARTGLMAGGLIVQAAESG